jgi:enoyl-CoA hydratase/carnithine racemase
VRSPSTTNRAQPIGRDRWTNCDSLEVGLVNEVIKREELDDRVYAIARHIARAPMTTLLADKANLKRAWELMGMRVHWQSSSDLVALASISKDVQQVIPASCDQSRLKSMTPRTTSPLS